MALHHEVVLTGDDAGRATQWAQHLAADVGDGNVIDEKGFCATDEASSMVGDIADDDGKMIHVALPESCSMYLRSRVRMNGAWRVENERREK